VTGVEIRVDPFPDLELFKALSVAAWGTPWEGSYDLEGVLRRSLVHLGAYRGRDLVGYVNVAWDGAIHAFLLDPMVRPDLRREGLGSALVGRATDLARERGATWLHVDYEPHLAGFYERCGFRPTAAGLIHL
jgi:GNAT superfamily N-acetyltransferase